MFSCWLMTSRTMSASTCRLAFIRKPGFTEQRKTLINAVGLYFISVFCFVSLFYTLRILYFSHNWEYEMDHHMKHQSCFYCYPYHLPYHTTKSQQIVASPLLHYRVNIKCRIFSFNLHISHFQY